MLFTYRCRILITDPLPPSRPARGDRETYTRSRSSNALAHDANPDEPINPYKHRYQCNTDEAPLPPPRKMRRLRDVHLLLRAHLRTGGRAVGRGNQGAILGHRGDQETRGVPARTQNVSGIQDPAARESKGNPRQRPNGNSVNGARKHYNSKGKDRP